MPGVDDRLPARRQVLLTGGVAALAMAARQAPAATANADLGLPGGPSQRPIDSAFPGKGEMILQRARPPMLETPMSVFDQGVLTPNERFFVRWHWADIPTAVDVATFRLAVRGHVASPLSLSLADILALPRQELVAVNQCSGNSRGLFQPRVAGGQWRHGAMGNARWRGVSLRRLLDRAGVRPGAVAVRFKGLDRPVVDDAPDFAKSISIDHARDDEVMIAFQMNGEQLPLLNGFPIRLVVPGWYSTYWVKMLSDIEVLDHSDDNYWMSTAYRIPDTPLANVSPTATGYPTTPINRMVPRAWITNLADGEKLAAASAVAVRGIAMGGDSGVAKVELSDDDGGSWRAAMLGSDEGKYSFRRFEGRLGPLRPGAASLMARCTNAAGAVQPMEANWNPGGFMRANVETTRVVAA